MVLEGGIVGRTERDVALDLEFAMRRRGASASSFPPIVAAGAARRAAARPAARRRRSRADTLVVIDWGAQKDGYASDCTRTFATGDVDPRDREVYDLVLRAQSEALAAVRPGPARAARSTRSPARSSTPPATPSTSATASGTASGSRSTRGRGCRSRARPRSPPATIVTVEPGVYVPGHVGVRIEDLVAITEDGNEVLSSLPKDLTTVD